MTADGLQLDGMGPLRRTHACGEILAPLVGQEVMVAGWVHRRRDHGGVIFVDLRDRDGIVQVVFRPETSAESHRRAGALRSEWVILARGVVEARSDDTVNPKMKTGEVAWRTREVRQGVIVFADGMLYVYEGPRGGTVSLVKATPSGYERTGSFKVTEGTLKHWAHPTIANGRMFLRGFQHLFCLKAKP